MSAPEIAEPQRRLDRALATIPRALSSRTHVVGLIGLGIVLIVLPAFGVHVTQFAELLGGNYTNVTSDIGACIAAGGTLHLVRKDRERTRAVHDTHQIMADLYKHTTGRDHEQAPRPLPALAAARPAPGHRGPADLR